MAKKQTKLPSGANSTRQAPLGSGYYVPNVPRWSGAWDAANMMTPNVVSPATTPYYGAPLNSGMGFTLPLWQNIRAYQAPAAAFSNVPAFSSTPNKSLVEDTTGAVPLGVENAPLNEYAQNQVFGDGGGGGLPQNYWWMSDEEKAATDKKWADLAADKERWSDIEQAAYLATYYGEYDENGNLIGVDNPRPGDPYQVYPYWKHQRFSSASYGPDGQKRKAAPQDPYSFRNRQRPNNTNKHRGAPPDNMTTTTEGGNLPAWAGDLVSWRT